MPAAALISGTLYARSYSYTARNTMEKSKNGREFLSPRARWLPLQTSPASVTFLSLTGTLGARSVEVTTMVVHRSGSLLPVPRSDPAVTVASTDLPAEARGSAPCLESGDILDAELATLDTQTETAQQVSPALYRGLEQAEEPRSSLLSGLNPKARSTTPNMSSDDSSCETTPRTPGSDEPSPSGNAANLDLWDPFSHESAAAAAARARQAAAAARATYKRVLGSQFVWLQTSYALSTMQAR